jgi:hypothetical protein
VEEVVVITLTGFGLPAKLARSRAVKGFDITAVIGHKFGGN